MATPSATAATTTNGNPAEENPLETLDPTSPKPHSESDPIPADKDADDNQSKETTPAEPETDAPLSDVQKKMRRAERFGITINLSEKEKRNSRAERFGTASVLQGPEGSKAEDLKRKARAERFGMPTPTTAADDDAKKKARLARFAAPGSKTDPAEEDKKKARALRFSNASSKPLSQVNSEASIESAAIAGNAGGGT